MSKQKQKQRTQHRPRESGGGREAEQEKESITPGRALLLFGGFIVAFYKERMETQKNCLSQKIV